MNLQVIKSAMRDGTVLISYVHPLTKRKNRKSFASAALADEYKIKLESRLSSSNYSLYTEMTIEELTILFRNERPKSPFFKLRLHMVDFIDTFGQLKIYEITTEMLRVWLDQIQQENKVADNTMRCLKCTLDRLFDFLIEKEIISESPLKEIYYRKTPADAVARNHLTSYEIERLLGAIKNYSPGYLYPIIKLFADSGAKVNEVVDLIWPQVDCIRRNVRFYGTERSQPRTVPISEELAVLLSKIQKESGPVFKTYYREPFTRVKLTRAINEFKSKKLYRGSWNLLDLRHSFGINFLANGGTMSELQVLMGHGNIFETKRIFADNKRSTSF